MGRFTTEKVVVGKGNLAMLPRNQQVFSYLNNGKTLVNAPVGRFLAYDPKTGVSIDATDLPNLEEFVFGVAEDRDKDGMADAVRALSGDVFKMRNIISLLSVGSECGVPHIVDAFVKCITCDNNHGIGVEIMDSTTDNQFPVGRGEQIVFTAPGGLCGCDDCTPSETAHEWTCAVAKLAAGEDTKSAFKYLSPSLDKWARDLPFTVQQLYYGTNGASYTFCLCPAQGECENCLNLPAITGIDLDAASAGGAGAVHNFTNNLDPADSTLTLTAQLDHIVYQINTALDGKGYAVLVHTPGRCCAYGIEINTCLQGAAVEDPADSRIKLLGDQGAEIDPCSVVDPGANLPVYSSCVGCGTPPGAQTFASALRFIAKPVTIEEGCIAANNTKRNLIRRLRVYAVGENWAEGAFFVNEVQKPTAPKGLGYTWAAKELRQEAGGMGRNHRLDNLYRGKHMLPIRDSRALAGSVDERESYCSINISHYNVYNKNSFSNFANIPKTISHILMPQKATTMQTSVLAFWNAVAADSRSPVQVTLTCNPMNVDANCPPGGQVLALGEPVAATALDIDCGEEAKVDTKATAKSSKKKETKVEATEVTK